jgi:hypothetical protein
MPIVVRCNVFQIMDADPGIRLPLDQIGIRFDETAKLMAIMTGNAINLAVAAGPIGITIKGLRVSATPALGRSIRRTPDFGNLRACPGFGPIHACYVQDFPVEQHDGKLEFVQGYTDYPFAFSEEYVPERRGEMPRWFPMLHEFGHLLLGRHHVDVVGNLMYRKEGAAPNVTPEQLKRMLRAAERIAAGGRPSVIMGSE